VFTSRPTSLLASVKGYTFFFMAFVLSPSRFLSSAQTSSWCVPFNFRPTWFSWTFLMAYYKAKLKSSGDKATESQSFLKSMNTWSTVSIHSHFLSSIWRMQKVCLVVDLLRLNSHWWSQIISCIYGLDLWRRILNKILYEVDSGDIPR
jgi:hypothetical protein